MWGEKRRVCAIRPPRSGIIYAFAISRVGNNQPPAYGRAAAATAHALSSAYLDGTEQHRAILRAIFSRRWQVAQFGPRGALCYFASVGNIGMAADSEAHG